MRVGIVGLGRMGANLALAAIDHGHEIIGYDPQEHVRNRLAGEGVTPATSLRELVSRLNRPRVVLIYVPHGEPTERACEHLRTVAADGDVIVDGGNSHWRDSRRRHDEFAAHAIGFLDVGTSGGLSGARNGACFMAGGERRHYDIVEPLLRDLAYDDRATLFVGPPGAGHFVKLIHNAIEFGMVESIAEGAEMLSRSEYQLDLPALFDNWNHGSVIRSWLVELMRDGLERVSDFAELSTYVEDTGEVKWVLGWALDRDIPSPVISESQQALMSSRDLDSVSAKAVALLRNAFGGHPVHGRSEQLVRT
ncbi:MAG TPA: decarboxylating 6-phosphogluconate dehydrogenase [Solirubrobacteraceae bacterium]|nr:decarboxylating 6-phosphogluconate dehydrogenase [Solirubrobacteraceae bacterium]